MSGRGVARSRSRSTLGAALLVTVVASAGWAHGGAYRGPAGALPPDSREPGDPPPPPPQGDGPSIGGQPRASVPGYQDWAFWWEREKDAVLASAVRSRGERISDDEARRWVIAPLRRLLREPDVNFDISSAAALALARMGDLGSKDALVRLSLAKRVSPDSNGRPHRVTEETAALALGLLGDGDAAVTETLRATLADQSRDSAFTRPFAALALALRERGDPDPATLAVLRKAISTKERKASVLPAAIVARGLIGGALEIDDLERLVSGEPAIANGRKPRENERIAAAAALSLTRGQASVRAIETLLPVVTGEGPRTVRRAALLALGRLAATTPSGGHSRDLVLRFPTWMSSPEFAMENEHIVQAIGIAAAESPPNSGRRGAAVALLRTLLSSADSAAVQANAAICLGLAERRVPPADRGSPAGLRRLFVSTKSPHHRAAYALALGLVEDREAIAELRSVLDDGDAHAELKGTCALALGLLGASELAPELVDQLKADRSREFHVHGAAALGLMGGDAARDFLLSHFAPGSRTESQYVLGAAAVALGSLRDADALPALVRAAEDERQERPDLTRALAVVAIGLICERQDAPKLTDVMRAIPRRTSVPAFFELLTIL